MGRDLLSRIFYGSRISLSIGLVGVFASLLIGLTLGGVSGYYGGVVDNIVQRLIELIRSIPTIPLWMGLAAALPPNWPQLRVYLGITVILSFVGWTTLARVIRGKFLALREEDYVLAALQAGARPGFVIREHLLPSFVSYILVHLTLAIPGLIIGETSLSFLGLGLVAPTISWGVLLKDAQKVPEVALHPWILSPRSSCWSPSWRSTSWATDYGMRPIRTVRGRNTCCVVRIPSGWGIAPLSVMIRNTQ